MWFLDPTLLLFLLLPVAAFSGWVIGRRQQSSHESSDQQNIPTDYIKGLNFFLNEQPDKAIDLFIQMLEVNKETVETHTALGNLFRRRGEVDRAIRIHQNLVQRATLNRQQRENALFELGLDYMRAGLLDRAESVFSEIIESNPKATNAMWQMIEVFQKEREWEKAIHVAEQIISNKEKMPSTLIAHFYCELSEQSIANGDRDKATDFVEKALQVEPKFARANILDANLSHHKQNYSRALAACQRVEQFEPVYLSEVMQILLDCHEKLGLQNNIEANLQDIFNRTGSISVLLLLGQWLEKSDGIYAAVALFERELQKHPSIAGIDKLLELQMTSEKGVLVDKLAALKNIIHQLVKHSFGYRCKHCGFSSRTLYWQCPSCRIWGGIRAIDTVEKMV